MSEHLHQRLSLNGGDTVRVQCDTQCNIMLMSDSDYSAYKRGSSFHYAGGHFKRFPALLPAPHAGTWNLVMDLGGGSASIRYSVQVIPA